MKFCADYLYREPDTSATERLPALIPLTFTIDGARVNGVLYLPDALYDGPYPVVCCFHGFPGRVTNDDIAWALCRAGAAVVRIYHRGAWGSEGDYSVRNCIGDAEYAARWAAAEGAEEYGLDPNRIFLLGHSMGGQTALIAGAELPFVRGVIAMAPFYAKWAFARESAEDFAAGLSKNGDCLRIPSCSNLAQEVQADLERLDFAARAEAFRGKHLLLLGAEMDDTCPAEACIGPLWKALENEPAVDAQRFSYPTDHNFASARIAAARRIGSWLEDRLQE